MTNVPQPQFIWNPVDQGNQIQKAALNLAASGTRVFPVWGVRRAQIPRAVAENETEFRGEIGWENRCGCGNAACPNPAKHPVGALVPNGHNGAVSDAGIVAGWFRVPENPPSLWVPYNIGVATGRGLLVLDADVKQSRGDLPTGLDVLDDWETWTQGTVLPRETYTVQTGSGGVHLWLSFDPALRIVARNRVLPGIDIKGDGGYVLAPPSLHISGKRYLVRDLNARRMPLGDDLRSWLMTVRGGRYISRRAQDAVGQEPDGYDFTKIIRGEGCPAGHRDYFINDLCFRLRRSGAVVEDAAGALRREWLRMEQPRGDEFPWDACLYKLKRVWDDVTPEQIVDIPAWRPVGKEVATYVFANEDEKENAAQKDETYFAEKVFVVSAADVLDRPDLTFATTDTGNGIRFAQRMREIVRYSAGEGIWYVWDGNHWAPDELNKVLLFTEELIKDLYAEAGKLDGPQRDHVMEWARVSQSVAKREAMLRAASVQPGVAIRADDLDADPWLLVVRNGTIDLRTGRLRESLPEDMCTRLAEVEWEPGARCPLWDKHLWFVTGGDLGLISWLRRAVGYSLTGLTTEQKLFFLWGNGANGKSTFVDVISALMGSYATAADAGLLTGAAEHSTQLAGLRGARLVVADETEAGRRLAERRVKSLTGGKKIKARFMRQDFFEFTPRFKLWITGNHKPEIVGGDYGMWRRLKLVPFSQVLSDDQRILGYDEVLEGELPGILNWALTGLADWRDVGGLEEPPAVREATRQYREEEDSIGQWLQECVLIGTQAGDYEESSRLYESYRWWCLSNGLHQQDIRSAVALGRELSARGLQREQKRVGGRVTKIWLAVRLISTAIN